MYNKKLLSTVLKDLEKAKRPAQEKDIDYNSKMGYRDDSPFRKKPKMDIYTEDGTIDMSNTGIDILANGRYLPKYSGLHQFDTNVVTETPLEQAKKGGAKSFSSNLQATNRIFKKNKLFKKNPLFKPNKLFKKKNYKSKTYDPMSMYFQDGGVPYNYNPFASVEPEVQKIPIPFNPIRTENDPEDYEQFLNYSQTAPENRRPDPNNPNEYDHYGMWDALGKPKTFEEALQMNPDWVPDEYDGYYHGFSVNPNTGVFLKSGKPGMKEGDTTWMEIAGHYLSPRADESTPVFDVDLQRFRYIPKEQYGGDIYAELTDDEIEEYRKGGYVVEEITDPSIPTLTRAQDGGQIYMYPGRKNTYYKKDSQGNWLIKSKDTGWKYKEITDPKGTRTKLLEANAKPVQKTTPQKTSNLVGPQAPPMPMGNALFDPNITARLDQERAQKKAQQQSTINIPNALVSDNTRTVVPDFAAAAVMNRPRVDAAVKEKEKQQREFEASKWKEYEKKSFLDQIGDRAQAFMVDPLGMASRFVSGEQAYIPGMGRGLVDRENPDYQNYLRSVGYTPGEFEISDVQNMLNPMYWGASIGNNMYKGNYGTAALEAAGTFLPMMPKGSVSASNIKAGLNLLADDVSRVGKYTPSKTPSSSAPPSYLKTLAKERGVTLKNKNLDKYAQDLPETLIQRRLDEFSHPMPRKRTIGSEEELEKLLKVDQYRVNKLKKQYPDLDFNNSAIDGYLFTNKESIEQIPDILKTINQNQKSGKSLATYVKKDFDTKMDFIKNSGNPVLKNIVDESPQYLDEVYTHLKNPKKTDEQFVNDLTIQSNTYTRFMKNSVDNFADQNLLNAVRGSNIDNTGFSMDIEGIRPSDYYGSYGYRIQPSIDRAIDIFQAPLAEKWSKRIPTFQGNMQIVPGMHTGLPENVQNALNIRNQRINRNIVKSYEGQDMTHSIPMKYMFNNTIRQNLPKEFIQSKYFTVPKHQVFNSPKYGQVLEGFETIPLGKLQSPEIYTGYKNNEDYTRFFEGTGKGFQQGGPIETELTPEEIEWYKKRGYIIEDLNEFEDGGTVKKRKKKKQDTGINVETGQPAEISDAVEYRLPYENAPEGATEVLYQTYPVPVKEKAPDWAKFEKEYLNTKPIEDFLYDKKIQYLKRNKGLNQAYGQTLENFPSQVEQTFRDEYEYKMNNYITQRLGQKNKFKPSRRGEWVDELTDRERSIVSNSKYESKLQPSVWSRTLSGARSAFNALPGPDITTQIPGLTKKENKEALTNWFEGAEVLAPLELPGTDIMNRVKNYNLSPNAQFKENPAIASGERRANVNDLDVMLPTLPLDIFGAAELIGNIPKGVKALKNFLKPTAATSEIIENIPASENVIETAFNSKSGKNVKTPASPDQILNKYDTYKDLGKKNSSLTQEEAEDFLANLPQENIDVIDEGKTWHARFPDAETTMSKQKEAFDFSTDVMERWAITDPDKYYKNKEIIRTAEKEKRKYKNNVFDKEHFDLHKKYAMEDGDYISSVVSSGSNQDEIYKTIDAYIKDKVSKDPDYARYQELEDVKNKTIKDLDESIENLKKESEDLIDPHFKWKVANVYKSAGVKQGDAANTLESIWKDRIKDRSKLVYMKEDDPAFKSLSPESQDELRKNWENIRGVRTKDDTITLASTPEKTYKLVYEPVGDTPSVKDFRLQEFKREVLNHPGQVGATQAHENAHDLQNFYGRWIDLLQEYNPDYGYYTGKDTNPIAKLFKEHMVEPKKVEAGSTKKWDYNTWLSGVGELHSELAKPRAAMVKYIMETENVSMENAIRMLKNTERAGYDPLYKTYLETHNLNKHFKPNTPFEIKKQLLKFLPATVPAAIGTGMMQQEKDGGSVYLEVSSDDIDKYVQGGYVVEEID
jgi:hypothetical protein